MHIPAYLCCHNSNINVDNPGDVAFCTLWGGGGGTYAHTCVSLLPQQGAHIGSSVEPDHLGTRGCSV